MTNYRIVRFVKSLRVDRTYGETFRVVSGRGRNYQTHFYCDTRAEAEAWIAATT